MVPGSGNSRRFRLPVFVDRALSIAVLDDDPNEVRRTKRLFAAVLWVALVTNLTAVYQLAAAGAPGAAFLLVGSFSVAAGSLVAMWVNPSTYPHVVHVIAAVTILVSSGLTLLFGGFLESGANSIWGFLSVLGALVVFEDLRAALWLAVFAVTTVISEIWASSIEPVYVLPNPRFQAVFNLVVVATFVFGALYYYVTQRAALLRQSEGLLRNILPDEIAERLKVSNQMIADRFDSASILFADVAGFTPMSAEMTPDQLVSVLDGLFTELDTLVEDRGLEKVKTIGDAYMVASGVPVPRPDHAQAICDLALAIQEKVEGGASAVGQIRLRIGISSGPVVAGIIGRRKFSYDLWGDAVNTASRMESSGTPGRIQISEATRDLIQDEFVIESGGVIEVKGKGPMAVWYLGSRK